MTRRPVPEIAGALRTETAGNLFLLNHRGLGAERPLLPNSPGTWLGVSHR
jgi:hypothetical protein